MGSLPEFRIRVASPFQHVGIDYAGPIMMRCSRGQQSFKSYIAVFVCMTTKAIHLEAVSDLISEAFMAALKRFFSRRGVSSEIYSDNGTNFIGANKKMDSDFKAAVQNNNTIGESKLTYEEMSTFLTQIDAVLNSRPLLELSGGDVLTPDIFLLEDR